MAEAEDANTHRHKNRAKDLEELLDGVPHQAVGSVKGKVIDEVVFDSGKARSGSLFVALPGTKIDGHNFVDEAKRKGCSALVVEEGRLAKPLSQMSAAEKEVGWIVVPDSREALGLIAAAFYGHPAKKLTMIGITGTNGKTTTSYLLEGMLVAAGARPGIIGTVNYRYCGIREEAPLTTPEPVALQGLLSRMVDKGATHVVMEVSSHALSQKRIAGLFFDVALFTNLSRDHLDFHGTMEDYFQSKKKLFVEHIKDDGVAVILTEKGFQEGRDWGQSLVDTLHERSEKFHGRPKVLDCGIGERAISLGKVQSSAKGILATVKTSDDTWKVNSSLVGDFNVKNLLGAVGVGTALGLDRKKSEKGLASVALVPGRLERVPNYGKAQVFVDYAHTPDALQSALQALKELKFGRLIVVFGCGGERDVGKRPLMGRVAGTLADVVLVTSDNPRSEKPSLILRDIERGMIGTPLVRRRAEWLLGQSDRQGYDVIESRREAIGLAVGKADENDVVLISGKGHEDYQVTISGRRYFDDREEARQQRRVIEW